MNSCPKTDANEQEIVSRPRVERLLSRVENHRVTTVVAPAGFGKTVLLRQWAEGHAAAGKEVAFLSAKSIKSVRERSTKGSSRQPDGPTFEEVKRLFGQTEGGLLIIDDADHIFRTPISGRWLISHLETGPRTLQIVLSSRRRLPVALSRLRLQGELFEIDRDVLRFSDEEASQFLRTVPMPDVQRLVTKTRGWAAGLRVLKMQRRYHDDDTAMSDVSGREELLASFFREEVFAGQPAKLIEFVKLSSLFGRFSASLCDFCFEQTTSAIAIRDAEDAGLFVEPLDKERRWFRYEPLFLEFLRAQHEEKRIGSSSIFHKRAASWFEANNLIEEAFEHSILHDLQSAAALLDRHAIVLSRTGQMRVVIALAKRLPISVISGFPTLLLTMAQFSSIEWRTTDSQELLKILDRREKTNAARNDDERQMEFLLKDQKMQVSFYEDDMFRVEAQCKELLRNLVGVEDAVVGHVYGCLLYAQREQFNFTEFSRLTETARRYFDRGGEVYPLIWHHVKVTPSFFMLGNLSAAADEAKQGYEIALRYARQFTHLASAPALLLAAICYERNEIDEANRLVQEYLPQSRGGLIDQLIAGYLTRSKIFCTSKDYDKALETVQGGLKLASDRGLDRLKQYLIEEQFRLLSICGELEKLRRLSHDEGFPISSKALFPTSGSTTRDERRAMAWIHAHAVVDAQGAVALAKRWRERLLRAGADGAQLSWNIMLVRLLATIGDEVGAVRILRSSLDLAAKGPFYRKFLDEDRIILTLVANQQSASRIVATPTDQFIDDIVQLSGMSKKDSQAQPDKLGLGAVANKRFSQKELDILFMAGSGLSNREIGKKFGLTEGSVKWYLQQIYNKVGTRRRAALIGRARFLGLAPRH